MYSPHLLALSFAGGIVLGCVVGTFHLQTETSIFEVNIEDNRIYDARGASKFKQESGQESIESPEMLSKDAFIMNLSTLLARCSDRDIEIALYQGSETDAAYMLAKLFQIDPDRALEAFVSFSIYGERAAIPGASTRLLSESFRLWAKVDGLQPADYLARNASLLRDSGVDYEFVAATTLSEWAVSNFDSVLQFVSKNQTEYDQNTIPTMVRIVAEMSVQEPQGTAESVFARDSETPNRSTMLNEATTLWYLQDEQGALEWMKKKGILENPNCWFQEYQKRADNIDFRQSLIGRLRELDPFFEIIPLH